MLLIFTPDASSLALNAPKQQTQSRNVGVAEDQFKILIVDLALFSWKRRFYRFIVEHRQTDEKTQGSPL